VIPSPEAVHISYLLTPMRYAWDMYGAYFGKNESRMILLVVHYLRMWDVTSSARVDHFLSISKHVAKRIQKFYRREAEVIHPPVKVDRFRVSNKRENFFLIVSSFAPYKKIDLAVETFNRLGYPLKIVGSGPAERKLRAMAGSNVEFLGWQPDEAVADCYSKCRALVFPGEEDFGIVPLEAMASGKPVIAYGRGGALETILSYDEQSQGRGKAPTGLFFHEQSIDSLIDAVNQFEKVERDFDPVSIRNHVLQWDRESFKERIQKAISEKMGVRC
jgi:glycosyltransferase involved in cell wall biosynthesis